jgi:hypothetical protein
MGGPQKYNEKSLDLIEMVRKVVHEFVISEIHMPITGTVKSVNTSNQTCTIQPEGERSELLEVPLRPLMAAGSDGIYGRPKLGTTVRIGFYNGDILRPYIEHTQEFDEVILQKAGAKVTINSAGDITQETGGQKTVHKTGGDIETTAAGNVKSTASGTQELSGAGGVGLTGPTVALGSLGASQALIRGNVFQGIFDGHVHPDAQGGMTGPPTTSAGPALSGTIKLD